MRDWLIFLGVVLGWAAVGRLVLEADIVHPVALAIVWIIGLIWLIGWAVGSIKDADYLVKLIAGMVAVPLAFVVLLTIAEYVI